MLFSIVRESSDPGPSVTTLVLLHGLGANEYDLMSFANYLDPRFRIESVRAPLMSPWGGYSWFDIDFSEAGIAIDGAGARASFGLLTGFLAERQNGPLILAGFSQGAMMTLSVVMERPDLIQGAIGMSGGLLPGFDFTPGPRPPILLTHGVADPVVPISEGRGAAESLAASGVPVDFRQYAMGHEINGDCLEDLASWLSERL
jgi:phospholipase/carboxylesterase